MRPTQILRFLRTKVPAARASSASVSSAALATTGVPQVAVKTAAAGTLLLLGAEAQRGDFPAEAMRLLRALGLRKEVPDRDEVLALLAHLDAQAATSVLTGNWRVCRVAVGTSAYSEFRAFFGYTGTTEWLLEAGLKGWFLASPEAVRNAARDASIESGELWRFVWRALAQGFALWDSSVGRHWEPATDMIPGIGWAIIVDEDSDEARHDEDADAALPAPPVVVPATPDEPPAAVPVNDQAAPPAAMLSAGLPGDSALATALAASHGVAAESASPISPVAAPADSSLASAPEPSALVVPPVEAPGSAPASASDPAVSVALSAYVAVPAYKRALVRHVHEIVRAQGLPAAAVLPLSELLGALIVLDTSWGRDDLAPHLRGAGATEHRPRWLKPASPIDPDPAGPSAGIVYDNGRVTTPLNELFSAFSAEAAVQAWIVQHALVRPDDKASGVRKVRLHGAVTLDRLLADLLTPPAYATDPEYARKVRTIAKSVSFQSQLRGN